MTFIANTSTQRWAVLRHKKRKLVAEVIGWDLVGSAGIIRGDPVLLVDGVPRLPEWPYPGNQRESVTLYKTEQEAETNA